MECVGLEEDGVEHGGELRIALHNGSAKEANKGGSGRGAGPRQGKKVVDNEPGK